MPRFDSSDFPPLPEYEGPFVARLPAIRSVPAIQKSFVRDPLHSDMDCRRPPEQRLHAVLRLLHYSQPTLKARDVGLQIDQMIRQSYIGRDLASTDWVRFLNACSALEKDERRKGTKQRGQVPAADVLSPLKPIRDTSMSGLIIGPPGMGKTHAVGTTLAGYDQVIFHQEPVQLAQIVWLRVECPPDGSLVSLCRFFFSAVDKALNEAGYPSSLHAQYKTAPIAVLLTGMARVANLHAIGLLVIDEIQHVKVNRAEGSALLNFLVTLRNTIGVSLLMIGTMSALPIMQRTFRDARRGDGIGSIPFERMAPAPPPAPSPTDAAEFTPTDNEGTSADEDAGERPIFGADFEGFVTRMWRWQYTKDHTELSTSILNALYHETQGIIDLVVKLFILCQMRLMTWTAADPANEEVITADLVHDVAKRSFNTVRPFVKALRENDQKALAACEDLIGFSDWFAAQTAGYGIAEVDPVFDADHGVTRLPPMIVEGAIDRSVVDQLLEGLGVSVKDREALLSRHAKLVESGNIAGLVTAVRSDLQGLDAHGKLTTAPKKKVPPIKGDLRTNLEGITDPTQVGEAIDAPCLQAALDE